MKNIAAKVLRKLYRKITRKKFLSPIACIDREHSNRLIYELLTNDSPIMISRFGTVELNCVNNYLCVTSKDNFYTKLYRYITDNTHTPWWDKKHFSFMENNAGFFPSNIKNCERFSQLYLDLAKDIDMLGSFQYYEKFIPLNKNVIKVHFETLYPFFVKKPWTLALKGKKVLVINPFSESIQSQYLRRKDIFKNQDLLPDFDLITLKSIQSFAREKVGFKNWFEALRFMENQINNIDFDICILGCGAYGLPLAAHVKRLGKKAIHLGGGVQLLFGIIGKRWENYVDYIEYRPDEFICTNYKSLFNEYWVRPDCAERIENSNLVENSCYW